MVRSLLVSLWLLSICGTALAQDSERDAELEARTSFERGVERAAEERWAEAIALFERSRALREKPATLLNLVLAYDKLGAPLDVLRNTRRFLRITDAQERYRTERAAMQLREASALAQVATLELRMTPEHATVLIDGAAALALNEQPLILAIAPGPHTVAVSAREYETSERRLEARAGQTIVFEVALQPPAKQLPFAPSVAAPPLVEPRPTLVSARRQRAARALAVLGGAATLGAVSAEFVAFQRGREVAGTAPGESGFIELADSYTRARRAVIPLAAAGGALLLAGVLAMPPDRVASTSRAGTFLLFSAALALAGGALALSLPSAPPLGASDLPAPRREAALILSSVSLSLFAWPVRVWLGK